VRKRLDPTRTLRELDAPELHALLGYAPTSEEQPLTGRVRMVPFWIGEAISTLEHIDERGRKLSPAGRQEGRVLDRRVCPERCRGDHTDPAVRRRRTRFALAERAGRKRGISIGKRASRARNERTDG